MIVIGNETATQKGFILNSSNTSIFPAHDAKKLALVGKILLRLDTILHALFFL